MMKIQQAIPSDATQLTELCMRSKNLWNYGDEQIEEWRDELTITPVYIDKNQVNNLIEGDQILGFYAYQFKNQTDIKLDFLFIEPKFIGKGLGIALMKDFFNRIEKTVYERILLDADPNAELFYKRYGFQVIGKLKTSIENRFLPIMELKREAVRIMN